MNGEGVAVMRYLMQGAGRIYSDEIGQHGEPGRWFPEAQSLARDRVIEANVELRAATVAWNEDKIANLDRFFDALAECARAGCALDRLDAAKAGGS